MSSATSTTSLPSGLAVLTTFPDVLFIPEIIFGGLVWILVASSKVQLPMLQGWVMFVSVFCFVMSITLLCLYICGAHGGSSSWVTLAVICQETASLFYLSMAVLEAYSTYISFGPANAVMMTVYPENVAAVEMETVVHDCIETIETVYASRPDLKEEPLEEADHTWYIDGSSFMLYNFRRQ
ncbi:myelin and lymphocyte protein-like [Phalacrocorax aristotelis]|uniref:myelin and lymphocyte protein-like n=2 Tax=Phalacrocorax aristotelis TaxID=126867 RepID=UPI003F4BFFE1